MRWGWFLLAFLIYGAALWMGAFRWHIALHLTGRAIHTSASARLFLIGHFFFVALFGAAGGDLAKSAVYARWYRFALPEVVAAAPLDRSLGLGGTVLLGAIMGGICVVNGGLVHLEKLDFDFPGVWILTALILAAAVVIALIFWRPVGESVWARTIRAFRSGGSRLILTPRVAASGLLFAMLTQLGLSLVLALNLLAVIQTPAPWAQLAWTFPVITVLSCMPFTVAGAGVREVAAITLLGLYSVPVEDCVAASLLTLFHKLAWAGIGAFVFWREESLQGRRASRPLPQTLSIIIPTLNEAEALPETVRRAQALPEVMEIIVVDGGSHDTTREVAEELGCRLLTSAPGRGGQMRLGAAQARGDVIVLLHADTWLPAEAGHALLNCLRDAMVVGGGFWKIFRQGSILLLGSRWKCGVRFYVGRRIAGDQAMFIRREVLEAVGGVPDMPLMEEFELCRRLHKVGRLALADATIVTSARRFAKLGVIRTYLRMWRVATLYRLGTSPHDLRRLYEKE